MNGETDGLRDKLALEYAKRESCPAPGENQLITAACDRTVAAHFKEGFDAAHAQLSVTCERMRAALEYYAMKENHEQQWIYNKEKRQDEYGTAVTFCDGSGERARKALETGERKEV